MKEGIFLAGNGGRQTVTVSGVNRDKISQEEI